HRALERAQALDHGHQFHAVVGGGRFAAEQFLLMRAHAQDHAPATGAGVAAAGAVRVQLDLLFRHHRHTSSSLVFIFFCTPPCRCVTGASALAAAFLSFQLGMITRMPSTRLTACSMYTPPAKGHQRSPAGSMKCQRLSHFSWLSGGA